jgi:hypothetical protein
MVETPMGFDWGWVGGWVVVVPLIHMLLVLFFLFLLLPFSFIFSLKFSYCNLGSCFVRLKTYTLCESEGFYHCFFFTLLCMCAGYFFFFFFYQSGSVLLFIFLSSSFNFKLHF